MALIAGKHGWPSSNVLDHVPQSEEDQSTLIDTLQDWKSLKYQEIVGKPSDQIVPTKMGQIYGLSRQTKQLESLPDITFLMVFIRWQIYFTPQHGTRIRSLMCRSVSNNDHHDESVFSVYGIQHASMFLITHLCWPIAFSMSCPQWHSTAVAVNKQTDAKSAPDVREVDVAMSQEPIRHIETDLHRSCVCHECYANMYILASTAMLSHHCCKLHTTCSPSLIEAEFT